MLSTWSEKGRKKIRWISIQINSIRESAPLTVNTAQQSNQIVTRNRLECDANDVTDIFTNGIVEAGDTGNVFGVSGGQNFRPEQFEIALFQNIGQENDFDHGVVFHLGRQQQALAQCEIGVREVGQRFQQNQICDFQIEIFRIELVQLQHGQIRFQIVFVSFGLVAHIVFERFQVLGIVSEMKIE